MSCKSVASGTVAVLIAASGMAQAQTGIIAGSVKDTTGAVLPGVTVEASSPALIEKVRMATTDGEGQYKIVDLRPGTYSVAFALTGFNTVKRDGVEVSSGFTANVAVEMRVGAMEETITVTGVSSLVDVQNTRQQTVMTRDVIDSIPTGKTAQDVGGSVGDKQVALIVHGSRSQEMPLLFDGMRYNNMNGTPGGSHVIWTINTGTVQEYTVEVGALSAEADVSGVRQNVIPKTGGNVFRGSTATGGTTSARRARFTTRIRPTTCTRLTGVARRSTRTGIRARISA